MPPFLLRGKKDLVKRKSFRNLEYKFTTMNEKRLYEIVEATGETLNGSLHILNTSESKADEREGKFRVYHAKGYCFDVEKEYACEPDEVKDLEGVESDGFTYTFYAEWEGFDNNLTVKEAFELIKTNSHLHISN
jgi:hypothetical protein